MYKCLLSAPHSGSGKTIFTCALLRALQKQGFSPCACKCGPDYIDPMFHEAVLSAPSLHLDLFLSLPGVVSSLFARHIATHDAVVCEGAMGLYDGVSGTLRASAWEVAEQLSLPVFLVISPDEAKELPHFLNNKEKNISSSLVKGIFLNRCSPEEYSFLSPCLFSQTGLPVLGYLPFLSSAAFPSRHLGLFTVEELQNVSERMDILGNCLLDTIDWPAFRSLCQGPNPVCPPPSHFPSPDVSIAVARDAAFCFCYTENLRLLEEAGARLVFFSPLSDSSLPADCTGLYLPGGYPELYAKALSENTAMRDCLRRAIHQGLPTVAECGGFLYLGQGLEDTSSLSYPQVGLLPGYGFATGKLIRFGYAYLTAQEDSLLFLKGEQIPVHEFHYWDSTQNGHAFWVEKPSGRRWEGGFAAPTLYASFPHLYFPSHPALANRFVNAARAYRRGVL